MSKLKLFNINRLRKILMLCGVHANDAAQAIIKWVSLKKRQDNELVDMQTRTKMVCEARRNMSAKER